MNLIFILNFKPLNLVTIKDAFPPPVIKDIFSRLKHSKYFVCLDMTKGFWQLKLADDSKHKTAFRTRKGLFHFSFSIFRFRKLSSHKNCYVCKIDPTSL